MTKPRLVKVRALFYVFQYITKQRGCANFDTASFIEIESPPSWIVFATERVLVTIGPDVIYQRLVVLHFVARQLEDETP